MFRKSWKTLWKFEPAKDLDFQPNDEHRHRLGLVSVVFFVACVVILLRLGQLHIMPGDRLADVDASRIAERSIIKPRGEIFDRNGQILATNLEIPSLYVDPRRVSDAPRLANYLSVHLGIDEEELMGRFARVDQEGRRRKMNTIKRWIDDVPEAKLREMVEFSGNALVLQYEPRRFYPQRESAAHLLGFVNIAGEASEGLELAFDNHLKSRSGLLKARTDHNRRLLPSSLVSYEDAEGGEMVQLTLDINMQHHLEHALDQRMEEVGAVAGLGMVMDPHTGAIFALASRPAFDPNLYRDAAPELRKNRTLLDVFEPGSVFKIVTAAAALEHGLVTPETMIDCENGAFNPYGHRIRDFYNLGVITFSRAFEKSSNIAMIKLAAQLGPERLEHWIRLFGFAERTSPQFQFEGRGLFRSHNQWSRLSMGSLPMGQEIAVTVPQLAQAFAVIANGGHVVQPYFVEKAVTQHREVTYQYEPPPATRILSPETAKTMQTLCHRVVLDGTGKAANIPEYRVGGKTGTAQMARTDGPGYDPDRYTTVFAGFAPVADPRVVAVIVIQEPTIRERWGGFVCGPVFKEVVRDALIRMNVPEDPVIEMDEDGQPILLSADKKRQPLTKLVSTTDTKTEEPVEIELDVDTIAPPPAPDDLDEDMDALLTSLDGLDLVARRMVTDPSQEAMPNVIGLTKREAREQLQRLGQLMDAQGAGWVVEQDPPAGALLEDITVCSLRFGGKMELDDDQDHDAG